MKTNYLLSNKFKIWGWLIFILGIILGLFFLFKGYDYEPLEIKVLSIFDDSVYLKEKNSSFFKIIKTGIANELSMIAVIIGGLIIGFSKEKIEDEFIYKLRKDSVIWAILFNYLVLLLSIVFIYNFTFFHVLVLNIFTPLLFFIIRFNFLKLKSRSNEE